MGTMKKRTVEQAQQRIDEILEGLTPIEKVLVIADAFREVYGDVRIEAYSDRYVIMSVERE